MIEAGAADLGGVPAAPDFLHALRALDGGPGRPAPPDERAALDLYYVNEFGNSMAIFENLVRGEFHFEAASNVGLVDAWESAWFHSPESAVLVDKHGQLSGRVGRLVRPPPDLDIPERALFLCRSLMNWTLMGANLWAGASTPVPRRS